MQTQSVSLPFVRPLAANLSDPGDTQASRSTEKMDAVELAGDTSTSESGQGPLVFGHNPVDPGQGDESSPDSDAAPAVFPPAVEVVPPPGFGDTLAQGGAHPGVVLAGYVAERVLTPSFTIRGQQHKLVVDGLVDESVKAGLADPTRCLTEPGQVAALFSDPQVQQAWHTMQNDLQQGLTAREVELDIQGGTWRANLGKNGALLLRNPGAVGPDGERLGSEQKIRLSGGDEPGRFDTVRLETVARDGDNRVEHLLRYTFDGAALTCIEETVDGSTVEPPPLPGEAA
ncbi:MAG: hypothetical protein AB1758_18015 [Candidatus Eremiobacterota bacterium]